MDEIQCPKCGGRKTYVQRLQSRVDPMTGEIFGIGLGGRLALIALLIIEIFAVMVTALKLQSWIAGVFVGAVVMTIIAFKGYAEYKSVGTYRVTCDLCKFWWVQREDEPFPEVKRVDKDLIARGEEALIRQGAEARARQQAIAEGWHVYNQLHKR